MNKQYIALHFSKSVLQIFVQRIPISTES